MVGYSGRGEPAALQLRPGGQSTTPSPLCQSLAGRPLDDLVAAQVLAALQPAALELQPGGGGRPGAGAAAAAPALAAATRAGPLRGRAGAAGSTRPSSRRTAWWPGNWNGAGKKR